MSIDCPSFSSGDRSKPGMVTLSVDMGVQSTGVTSTVTGTSSTLGTISTSGDTTGGTTVVATGGATEGSVSESAPTSIQSNSETPESGWGGSVYDHRNISLNSAHKWSDYKMIHLSMWFFVSKKVK